MLEDRLSRCLTIMIRKNDDNYYQSNLRYVFTQWAAFVKRQTAFVKAIEKVITKSMQQQGVDEIKAFARDKKITRT